jgi:PAS domain S-box-containing protein
MSEIMSDITVDLRDDRTRLITADVWDIASKTGQAYLEALVAYLGRQLGVRLAFVVRALDDQGLTLCPLAHWGEADYKTDYRGGYCYPSAGTPCGGIGGTQYTHYPERLRALFPEDEWLQGTTLESYLAVPLRTGSGVLLGHLGFMDDHPLPDAEAKLALVQAFLPRTAAELERMHRDGLISWAFGPVPYAVYRARPPQFAVEFLQINIPEILGFTAEETRAYPDLRCRQLYEDDRGRVIASLATALDTGKDVMLQYRLWDRDRRNLHRFQDYVRVEHDAQGQPIGLAGVMLDITAPREPDDGAWREERGILSRMNDFPGMVFRCRGETAQVMEFVSGSSRAFIGYLPSKVIGLGYYQLIHPGDRDRVMTERQRALRAREPLHLEYRIIDAHQQERYVSEIGHWIQRHDGEPVLEGLVVDITDRKRAEAELRESEARFRSISAAANDAIILIDDHGQITFWNQAATKTFGYTAEEVLGQELHILLAPGRYQADIEKGLRQFHQTGTGPIIGHTRELEAKRKDGTEFPIELSVASVQMHEQWHAVGVVRDITDRRQAEAALRQERARLESYLENAPVITVVLDREGIVQLVNRKGCEILGGAAGEILGRDWIETFLPEPVRAETRQAFREFVAGQLAAMEYHENRVLSRSGEEYIIAWHNALLRNPQGEVSAVLSSGEDVTERRRAERALAAARGRLQFVVSNVPAVIFACKGGHGLPLSFVSDNIREQLGYEPQELIGRSGFYQEYAHPEDLPQMMGEMSRLLEQGIHWHEFRFHCKDGSYRWVQARARMLRDDQGRPAEIVGYLLDVTARKEAEMALRQREAMLSHAQKIAHLGSWELDHMSGAEKWSDEFYRILGYAPGAFPPSQEMFMKRVHPQDVARLQAAIREALATQAGYDLEVRIKRPNGRERFIHIKTEIERSRDGAAVRTVGTLYDMSERKRMEQRLRQSREQLRNLAVHLQSARELERAAIAREIHDEMAQALTALKIDLARLKGRIPARSEDLHGLVSDMLESINTTIAAVQRLMSELRPAVLDDLGLIPAVEWQLEQFQERTGIRCSFECRTRGAELSRDGNLALFRILQESLTNVARHANATNIRIELVREENWLVLQVADNGRGISPSEIESARSFGLMGMRERAHVFGGQVEIRGREGGGTTVRVRMPFLPRSAETSNHVSNITH